LTVTDNGFIFGGGEEWYHLWEIHGST